MRIFYSREDTEILQEQTQEEIEVNDDEEEEDMAEAEEFQSRFFSSYE